MIITFTIISALAAVFLTTSVYYRSKFWDYEELSEKATREKIEMEEQLVEEKETIKKKCLKKFKNLLTKKTAEIEQKYLKKYDLLAKDLELEYNNACEEVKNELFQQLEVVDETIKQHAENLALKNILTFSCSCSRDLIPVGIDFSRENTFVCPKCGSKYRIAISANPVLIGRAVSDEQFADLIEERLNENKRENN
jgi:hypothetical protein